MAVPTLDGEETLKIPPATQPGKILRMKGKGVPRIDGRGRGALHIIVQVDVPKRVSAKARSLLQELQKENARLKRLVADQALDNQILREAARPNW